MTDKTRAMLGDHEAGCTATQVAKYIVDYCLRAGWPITNFKLQEILLYVLAEYKRQTKKDLFPAQITMKSNLVLISEVHELYKWYGASPICEPFEDTQLPEAVRQIVEDAIAKELPVTKLVGNRIKGGPAMTWEEAISRIQDHMERHRIGKYPHIRLKEAFELALSALRPVSREQVEKMWRGEWIGSADGSADGELVYDTWTCSECGYVIDEEDDPDMLPQFCPKCYAAMTDEAVDMVMERLEMMKND